MLQNSFESTFNFGSRIQSASETFLTDAVCCSWNSAHLCCCRTCRHPSVATFFTSLKFVWLLVMYLMHLLWPWPLTFWLSNGTRSYTCCWQPVYQIWTFCFISLLIY